jgi:hypothetical protein
VDAIDDPCQGSVAEIHVIGLPARSAYVDGVIVLLSGRPAAKWIAAARVGVNVDIEDSVHRGPLRNVRGKGEKPGLGILAREDHLLPLRGVTGIVQ